MNEAIKLARQHGYPVDIKGSIYNDDIVNPLFWQALSRALGWKEKTSRTYPIKELSLSTWLHRALEYHYLVLTGGDLDAFWKDLLTNP